MERQYYLKGLFRMKGVAKGVVLTLVGVVICREFYTYGWNGAMKHVRKMADFREEVLKGKEGS